MVAYSSDEPLSGIVCKFKISLSIVFLSFAKNKFCIFSSLNRKCSEMESYHTIQRTFILYCSHTPRIKVHLHFRGCCGFGGEIMWTWCVWLTLVQYRSPSQHYKCMAIVYSTRLRLANNFVKPYYYCYVHKAAYTSRNTLQRCWII